MKRKSAFTLIELLVVIAIIATLAALLFPSLTAFMERGRATDDANNLSGFGKVLNQYMSDQKGSFFSLDAAGEDTWPKVLYRNYMNKDWRPFRSPFDRPTTARPKNKDTDPVPVSYGLNENLFDTFEGKWKAPRSTLVMMAPAVEKSNDKVPTFAASATSTSNVKVTTPGGSGKQMDKGYGTHESRQKINVLFADGHVENKEIHKYDDSTTAPKGKQQWLPDYDAP